jgi:hypothetical protein
VSTTLLLVAGLLFPALSLLTVTGSFIHRWRYQKYASPVMIPFVGPILLTIWAVVTDQSNWLVPIFWIGDLGTVAFLAVSPRLVRDWWRVSSFTRILTLHGSKDIQTAIITLHSTGHYLLKRSWNRLPGEIGIGGLGEPGTYIQAEGQYELTAHHGLRRILRKTDDGAYVVEEGPPPNASLQVYTLNGWLFSP